MTFNQFNLKKVETVEQDKKRKREPVYSLRLRAGKRRTYFFDVRPTKSNDFYLTITESKKRFDDDGYERHKLFLYKEDFNKFMNALELTFDHVKQNLMPEYDFDEFTREIKDENIQENPEAIPDELDVPANKPTEGDSEGSEDEGAGSEAKSGESEDDNFEVSFDADFGDSSEDASDESDTEEEKSDESEDDDDKKNEDAEKW